MEFAGLLIVLAAAFAIRAPYMGRGLGYDEIFTAMNFVELPTLWGTISTYIDFNNHPLYSLLARWSQQLLGRSEWSLRLPALVAGLLGIVAVWLLARPLGGAVGALAAAAILAIAPAHILWSTSARGYTGMMLGATVASWLFLKVLGGAGRAAVVGLAISHSLAIYSHLFGVAVLGAQAIVVAGMLFRDSRAGRRLDRAHVAAILGLLGGGVLAALLYLPLLPGLLLSLRRTAGGAMLPWFPVDVWSELVGPVAAPLLVAFALLGVLAWRRTLRRSPLLGAYLVVLFLLPLGAFWLARPSDSYARFFVFLLPHYAALLGIGCGTSAGERVSLAMSLPHWTVGLFPVVGLFAFWSVWSTVTPSLVTDEGYRAASQSIREGGSRTVRCGLGGGADLFRYYGGADVAVPESVNEFLRRARQSDEIRCAHRPASWEPRFHAEIARLLTQAGSAERIGNMVVYIADPRRLGPP
jgi:4-amino-4-deoxy-L-arabinose transferase-like glycosyltransferase